MAADDRLKQIKSKLQQLDNRATAFARERDNYQLKYLARAQAVFTLEELNFQLETLINHNTIMSGHLSRNERLQKLQKENEELKQELEQLKSQQSPEDNGDDQGDENGEMENADQQQLDDTLNEMSVDDVRKFVKDVDDVDALEKMLDAELDGKNRKTAVGAIESRINDLTESAED